jgi:O-antigen/teichoic acid export membrane protein
MLDPIKSTIASLFTAVGQPQQLAYVRFIQLIVLVVGLFAFGPLWGIRGVALTVNVMLLVGILIMMAKINVYIDFSPRKMFLVPLASLIAGLVFAQGYFYLQTTISSDWYTLIVKSIIFIPVYLGILLIFESQESLKMIRIIIQKFAPAKWNRK